LASLTRRHSREPNRDGVKKDDKQARVKHRLYLTGTTHQNTSRG